MTSSPSEIQLVIERLCGHSVTVSLKEADAVWHSACPVCVAEEIPQSNAPGAPMWQ